MDQFDTRVCNSIGDCVIIELRVINSVLGCNDYFVIGIAKGGYCKVQSYKDLLLCWLDSDTKQIKQVFQL